MPYANEADGVAYRKRYYERNKKRICRAHRARYHGSTKFRIEQHRRNRKWYLKHRDIAAAATRRHSRKLKMELIAAYGYKCECCGESEPNFLTIEHRRGDGRQHR